MTTYEFGNFLSQLRKEKGLTQLQLAEQLNVSDKAISRWETGKNYPDIDIFENISKIFDIYISELLEGKRNNYNDNNNFGLKEQYMISVSKDEYMNIYKHLSKIRNKAIIKFVFFLIFISLIFLPFEIFATYAFLFVDLLYIIIAISTIFTEKKDLVKQKSGC